MADTTAAADTLAYVALLAALLGRLLAAVLPELAVTHPEPARLCARAIGQHTAPARA
jgi:hypothetical protein